MEVEFRVPDHAAYIEAILEGFISAAELMYRCGAAPKPHAGWKLEEEPAGRERWQLPDESEELGTLDCEDLVIAWAGWLRAHGVDRRARARILQVAPGEVHCLLLRGNGELVDVCALHEKAQGRTTMGGWWSKLKHAVSKGVNAVGHGLSAAEHAVEKGVHFAAELPGKALNEAASLGADALKSVGSAVQTAEHAVGGLVGDVVHGAGGAIGDAIHGVGAGVADVANAVGGELSDAGHAVSSALGGGGGDQGDPGGGDPGDAGGDPGGGGGPEENPYGEAYDGSDAFAGIPDDELFDNGAGGFDDADYPNNHKEAE